MFKIQIYTSIVFEFEFVKMHQKARNVSVMFQ